MKKILIIICIIFLPIIFGPILIVQNNSISLIGGVFDGNFSVFNILCLIEILLIFLIIFFINFKKLNILSLIFSIILVSLLFFNKTIFDTSHNCNSIVGPALFLLIIFSIFLLIFSIIFLNKNFYLNINDIVEIGLFVAIAIGLDALNIKIRIGGNGGSISLTMIPLIILCLRKGFYKGIISCGLIFGLINCFIDGFGFVSFPLDYLLSFGSLAIVGLFRNQIINSKYKISLKGCMFLFLSITIAISMRFVFSSISGIVIWGYNFWGSIIYQASYLIPSYLITIIILFVLYKPILLIEKHFKNNK